VKKSICKNGHALTGRNVIWNQIQEYRVRRCRLCSYRYQYRLKRIKRSRAIAALEREFEPLPQEGRA
jgi:hypothetical protein